MAGDHGTIKIDPAIERWGAMRDNLWRGFRMTPYATRKVAIWLGLVPLSMGALALSLDRKVQWRATRKGESLLGSTPAASTEEE
ncbi:hypothetical protein RhiJN_28574 [Ceratobasidium sp. AG-Ba]|nr:hypothetical protein RhiJN_14527 [Ceratobasidium sp. AG-Ba]QRW00556.1 hypothetical protein RhiJN_28574 [Ceratobasidium sp. AG-Ba]QRW15071.1 hypothetical protein RhiLY_14070 [Ceratobasidium sp. AG-Ba]